MLENNTLIKVRNRDNGIVGYVIPELNNLRREFAKGETKEISMDELRKLTWTSGGKALLQDYLIIENPEAVVELLGEVEPEYNYTEKEIEDLLLNGSLDAFLDCLDYAPEGVIGIIKDLAVKLELNDVAKRKAILEKTGFNVDSAITINKESQEENAETETKTRRVAAPTVNTSEQTGRRAATPTTEKYTNVTFIENK